MGKYSAVGGMLAIVMLLGACRSSGPVADGGPNDPFFGGADADNGAQTSGIGGPGSIPMTEAERREAARRAEVMANIVVYFDFDQSDIRAEFNQMLAEHAGFLADYPNARVRLEGHADETGSREYNIGLGERRAQAVRRVLMLQGVSPGQLNTVSYGEERPAALGSDEESYSLNRRVELVYE